MEGGGGVSPWGVLTAAPSPQRANLRSLQGREWLNDVVINVYLAMLMARSQADPALPRLWLVRGCLFFPPRRRGGCYCRLTLSLARRTFTTFFYEMLKTRGHQGVSRWTKLCEGTIFKRDLVVVPLHVGQTHWCCGVVDFRHKRLGYEELRCLLAVGRPIAFRVSEFTGARPPSPLLGAGCTIRSGPRKSASSP